MSNTRLSGIPAQVRNQSIGQVRVWQLLLGAIAVLASGQALANSCPNGGRTLTANVVAFDQPLMYNRLGASNINGMMYALKRDTVDTAGVPLTQGGAAVAGQVFLRPDKRPRPLILRVAAGDCLKVVFKNLLTPAANPRNAPINGPITGVPPFNVQIDDQPESRFAGFHVSGMQLVDSMASDSSWVGKNTSSLAVAEGGEATYMLYAEKEGVFLAQSYGTTIGSDANQGNASNGLFGQVVVEPKGARIYRSIVTEEEMRLATTSTTATGHPVIDYEATYPTTGVWVAEGKAGLPVLNTIQNYQIVHSEIEAMVVGPNADGSFPPSTYPLESVGLRNPTVPNRLEPFRDLGQVWHDEPATAQAFPGFYNDPVFGYVLAGVKDGFMINYGSGGIGSEIIANRLKVGPSLNLKYFLCSDLLPVLKLISV